ncbi:MAG: flippase [Candidatus Moranbacteria bacterium]|nr:flippase [Candidatus Moranbacteria bacterium]NCA93988.1 flippase [Sphingobacteriia bacterium]
MLARKIAYNVVINTVAKILSTVLALVNIGFITRYLGINGFGDYATVLAFFSFFGAILDLGLYSVSTREISRKNADQEKIMGNVFTLRILSSFLVVVIAPILIWILPYGQNIEKGILIIALNYVFSSSYMVLNGVFQKNLRMDKVTITEFFGKVVQVFFVAMAVKFDWGFDAIMFSVLANTLFTFLIVIFLSRKYVRFSLSFDWIYWKKFFRMSFPVGISAMVTFLYFKMDTIILSILKGSEAVGIYNMAYKIIENITFFPGMMVGLILPLLSMYIFTDKQKFTKIINETAKVFFLLVVPLVIGTLFLAEDIISIIGGEDFIISANVLRILIVALAFIFFGNLFNSILIAANLQKKLMYILSFCAFFNIVLNLIFIPIYSYSGAATVSVLTELLVVAITAYFASRDLDYRFSTRGWEKIIFSGLMMGTFLFLFGKIEFVFAFFGSVSVYLLFLWLTRAITVREVRSLLFSN